MKLFVHGLSITKIIFVPKSRLNSARHSALAIVRARPFPPRRTWRRCSGGKGRPTSEVSQRSARSEFGVSWAGWSVTWVWCVDARATDARQPTCGERASCREKHRVVMTLAWVAVIASRQPASQPASGVSGTWRAIPGALIRDASSPSTVVEAAAAEVRRRGANCYWSSWRCCWQSSSLSRTPRVKVSHAYFSCIFFVVCYGAFVVFSSVTLDFQRFVASCSRMELYRVV